MTPGQMRTKYAGTSCDFRFGYRCTVHGGYRQERRLNLPKRGYWRRRWMTMPKRKRESLKVGCVVEFNFGSLE